MSQRGAVHALGDQPPPMDFHTLEEIPAVAGRRCRPEHFRHGAGAWPHLPLKIVLVPGVFAPVAALATKDVMTEILRDTRAGVERVDLAPPAFAACVWT